MKNDIFQEIYKIVTKVQETEDEFIFETVKSWCEEKTQRTISKKVLEQALLQYFNEGYWVGIEYDSFADGCPVYDVWECSECGEEHKGEKDTLPNFCPNCGADMRVQKKWNTKN